MVIVVIVGGDAMGVKSQVRAYSITPLSVHVALYVLSES